MPVRIFAVLALCTLCLSSTHARQITEFERSRYSPAAFYNYAEPGDVTIIVSVWGAVRNPGLYEVPQGTQLREIVSLSGGPSIQARRKQDRRSITIQLARINSATGQSDTIFNQVMEDEISSLQSNLALTENDVVTVEILLRQRLTWRDLFPIIAALGSIALAIERVTN